MNNLFNSITELFVLLPRLAEEELRRLRNSIVCLIGFLYAIFLTQLAFNNYYISSTVGAILGIISLFVMYNIRRILNITWVGEALEVMRITPPTIQAGVEGEGSAAVIVNPLSSIFWNASLQILFFFIIATLLVPTLPLRNNPMTVVLFPTLAIAIALAFKGTALRVVNWLSGVFILLLVIYHIAGLFPAVKFYWNNPKTSLELPADGIVPEEAAKEANAVEELRQKQRADALKSAYELARRWQAQSPGRDLPQEINEEIAAAKKGLTARELRFQRQAEKDEKTTADLEKTKEDFFIHLPDGSIKAVFHSNNDWAKSDFFFPGKYTVTPGDKKFKIATKLSKNVYEEHVGEFTIPETPNGESVFIFFWSGEPDTFILKREEVKKG